MRKAFNLKYWEKSLWSAKIHQAINKPDSESLNVSLWVLYCSITPLLTEQMNTLKALSILSWGRGHLVMRSHQNDRSAINYQTVYSAVWKIRGDSVKSLFHEDSRIFISKEQVGDLHFLSILFLHRRNFSKNLCLLQNCCYKHSWRKIITWLA